MSSAAAASVAAPAAVPGPPAGWSTVFSDDFNGAAGSGVGSQWMYDTGPGANFGTGEIETMTSSTSNVHLDGNGNLDITAQGGSGLTACGGCQGGYHTYSMILNRTNSSDESVTFYLDGNQYFSVSESQVGTATWQAAYDHNLSIILDLAMGGGFPNGACNCTTPTSATVSGGTMSVAYVTAYSTSGGGTGGGGGGGSASGPIIGYDGLCVDVRGAGTANFTPVQVYTCNSTSAQQWSVVAAGNTLRALGKCMDVNAGGTADGTTVDLYDCNNTAAQVFIPQSNGELYNPQSNKCLDDTGYGGSGTQLQIWDCADTANQQWNLP
jgi:hypothetical protein